MEDAFLSSTVQTPSSYDCIGPLGRRRFGASDVSDAAATASSAAAAVIPSNIGTSFKFDKLEVLHPHTQSRAEVTTASSTMDTIVFIRVFPSFEEFIDPPSDIKPYSLIIMR
jgi:hypothetical protein